jgi:hypothetical protein
MMRRSLLAALLAALALPALAQEAPPAERPAPVPPMAFASPEAGFAALAAAMAAQDEARLLRILGDAGRPLIRSGDPVADRAARARFAALHAEGHRITRPAPGRAELEVGPDSWPLPVPMIERGGRWRFDARAGAEEVLNRRIGRNELDTVAALGEIVRAQREYAAGAGRDGSLQAYARRFFSQPGQRDGLYWPTGPGEAPSPLGALAAAASAGGYARVAAGDAPRPFHGYFFRMLEGQGPAASGGAIDYLAGGRMIGGFAVLAWPAQWGNSGVQSFLVNHHGEVFQANLGPETPRRAAAITRFDPGPGWSRVAE